jgi:hypothetical protein
LELEKMKLQPISDICHTILFKIEDNSDVCHIYTDKYYFMIPSSGLEHLVYGLEAHYKQTELLFGFTDEELTILAKKRPRRAFMEEIEYQIERKDYNGKYILASDLISRLPFMSQSRNRNGKQHIADSRWKKAIKDENSDVLRLIDYYAEEESVIRTKFPDVRWTKGSFAISPCHIYPALKDRGEDSWTPDKILRDLSIVNKVFDKISACDLKGKHAIDADDAQIAINYLDEYDWNKLSVSRQVLYVILQRRIAQDFYSEYKIIDTDLDI